jgi:hypothetical protein
VRRGNSRANEVVLGSRRDLCRSAASNDSKLVLNETDWMYAKMSMRRWSTPTPMSSAKLVRKATERGVNELLVKSSGGGKRVKAARRLTVKRRTLNPIGSLEDFIPYKLAVVANRVSQSIGHLFETQFNLQMPEWRILMALYAYGDLAFNEVVDRTSMDKARVSRAQRRLVDLNMIQTIRATDVGSSCH